MTIVRYPSRSAIPDTASLFETVDAVQAGVPYNDDSGTLQAKVWLPETLDASEFIFLYTAAGRHAAYLTAQPYLTYGRFANAPAEYGVEAAHCLYISELGVAETHRGRGIGTHLLQALLGQIPARFDSVLVRTMQWIFPTQTPNPAIDFYRLQGFDVVGGAKGPLIEDDGPMKARPRIFLRYRREQGRRLQPTLPRI